jgi:hypothetical protein
MFLGIYPAGIENPVTSMGRSRSRREHNVNKSPINVYGVDRIILAYDRVEERAHGVQRGFGFREG